MFVGQMWENCMRVFSSVCTEVTVKFILMELKLAFYGDDSEINTEKGGIAELFSFCFSLP